MLYKIQSNGQLKPVVKIPHEPQFLEWCDRLTHEEFDAIYDHLFALIDGAEIRTSSWIPGSRWYGTVFWPIYETACNQDSGAAAKFFGLILWQVVMEHPDKWSFGRYELDDTPIEGMTYFRIQ
ncbi:MAG: hypothetical protein WD049_04485 [Candidatus Paceibacterota bacterium]